MRGQTEGVPQGLHALLQTMNEKLDTVLELLGKKKRLVTLSPKQAAVFRRIERVSGTDARARTQVRDLLAALEGERVTEALTTALKQVLSDRGWKMRCGCGEPASPLWRRNPMYAEGGCMQLTHTGPSGRSVTHGGMSRFSRPILIARPDRRRRTS